MATLYERGGHYYLNYTVNGRRSRKSLGTDRRKAEMTLKELDYRLFRGDFEPDRPDVSLSQLVTEYLEHSTSRLQPSTLKRYRAALAHFQDYTTNRQPIAHVRQVTRYLLSTYVDFRQGQRQRPRANTINQELTIVRAMLNFAVDRGYIPHNPAHKISMCKVNDAKKGRVIPDDQVRRLLEGCGAVKDGIWYRDILLVLLNTGMRLGKLINLTWGDIDWEHGDIKIQAKPHWSPKTFARTIPMSARVRAILEHHKDDGKTGYVFDWRGGKIKDNKLRKKLLTLSRRVGLPHITRIHDFRHSFASNLLMKGVPIPTVQALLGHRSWSTTLVYSHQTEQHMKEAVRQLD